jgi:hypothetical protein
VLTSDPTLTETEYEDEHGNDVKARIFDTVPPEAKRPYVAIGKAAINIDKEKQTKDLFIDNYLVEIDCFTHYGGKKQVSELMNDVIFALSSAWASVPPTLQFPEESPFMVGVFEIGVRGEDVSVWGAKEAEHDVLTCNVQVVQVS